MMAEDAALPVALLLHYERGRYGSGPRITARPVRIDTTNGREHPRGMIDDPLDDLTISAYLDPERPDDNGRALTWGWGIEYRDLHSVDERRAAVMLATLRRIRAAMDRTAARYGRPVTFGAYLLHAAAALRIDRYTYRTDPDAPNPDATYSAVDWTTTNAAGAETWTLGAARRAMRPRG
jgi:hypothetical protein